ncbi:MAG: transcription-repair coupling factor [Acidobacteriaceae bacterium]
MILPFVREFFSDLDKSPGIDRLRPSLVSGVGRRRVSGLTATARALYLPLLARISKVPVFVVVSDNRAAEALQLTVQAACDLTGELDRTAVVRLPAHDVLPFENLSPHPDIQEQRAVTLWKIARGAARLIILPVESACYRIFAAEHYANLACTLRRGEEADPETLVAHLASVGYQPVDMVEMRGQYALRGGIFDIYPPEMDGPLRIEFLGDEIESMRKFDPETQRSSAPVDEAVLLPLTETPMTNALLSRVHTRLSGQRLEGENEALHEAIEAEGTNVFPGWEFFAVAASGQHQTVFDMIPKCRIFVEEPGMVQNQLERWWNKVEQRHERSGIDTLFPPADLYLTPSEWQTRVADAPGLDLDQLGTVDVLDTDTTSLGEIEIPTRPTLRLHGSIPALVEQLQALAAHETRTVLAAANQGEVERLAGILQEYGISYRIGSRSAHTGSETMYDETSYLRGDMRAPVIVRTEISNGVVLEDARLVVFGANDLSDEADVTARPVARKSKSNTAAFISDFRDLTIGDYVVHVDHGIARYLGLKEISQDGMHVEFMILEFAEAARLYVPLTRLDLIQKYRSTDTGPAPVLHRLGSAQWTRTKARVKKAMADMADELLKLYAVRKAARGNAFSVDNQFQREFEDAFDFNETDDQITSIADIKRDMESTMPMDRLLVGDVGYGKTEVAMRAAFKAVQDSKQVAVLTPTTVLCFQHFETFKRRFAAFPVHIEMISRFRSPKEQKAILEKVEQGKVDILIGTHRLLSKDLKFQDLGLLVVDEEQRFGVRHKERLKQMRREIDVLAMSATPIPRTLHMSLVGLRDMSVIETPPKDRMAIQTVVAKYDEKLIRSAIEVELERGGQIYFVHNRVDNIYEIAARLQELVPQARIGVGHGQMGEAELERVMLAFMHHEYDVLVATTIIENGLDIPLANTILINRADRHGLSELYQLRGRVGRSNRRAYSYLLIPPDRELTDIARRRLAALKEFSDLGAGFKIAALDLELRGAGNMLGGEQSGHIEAVGFELYTTMLEQAVRELKGEDQVERPPVQLNLGISLRIDANYIEEENQRLRMYKRIASAEDESAIEDILAEMQDRYGVMPEPVQLLVTAGRLRLLCEQTGVAQMDRKGQMVSVRFTETANIDPEKLMQLVARNAKRGAQFTPQGVLRFPVKATVPAEVLAELRRLIEALATPLFVNSSVKEVGSQTVR